MSESWRSETLHQCPCCDYFTLDERAGYDICPVCFWEDDGLDMKDLDVHSGPNGMTLRNARNNFLKFGACAPGRVVPEEERRRYRRAARFPP